MTVSRAAFLRLFLWTIAGLAACAGAVAWVRPPATAVGPVAPVIPDPGTPPTLAIATAAAEEVVMANLFMATRTPPATRYQPPELIEESANGMMAPDPAMTGLVPDSAMSAGEVPRLLGTVVAPGGPRALLQLSLASGPQLYAVGDRDGGFTVLAIDPRVVVLRGPGGRRTLRLEPEE